MNRTIYVRDEDAAIWDRARELAGDKLSPLVIRELKRFVWRKEGESKGFERIEVLFRDSDDHNFPKAKAFYGRWIFPPNDPYKTLNFSGDCLDYSHTAFAVAETAKGAVVVYSWQGDETDGTGSEFFRIYSSLEDAAQDRGINACVTAAMEKRGVPVEELDI